MARTPDFAAYHVATVRDGGFNPAQPGDLTVWDDGKTYVYRGLDAHSFPAFFDWADGLFCNSDEPKRLVGDPTMGWRVERGFQAPPGPPDDSEEYQAYLDGPYRAALSAWAAEFRPASS